MTKWNCGKSGSPEHWDRGKDEVFLELNSHFFLITWDQGLVPVEESKGPHLEVTRLPATKEGTIPSTDQNSLCPYLVNTSLSVIQVEFCLSKVVNAVAKEYYCSKSCQTLDARFGNKYTLYTLQCDVLSQKTLVLQTVSCLLALTPQLCAMFLFALFYISANFLVVDEEGFIHDSWHTIHFLYFL